jgi:flagellar FliL protein
MADEADTAPEKDGADGEDAAPAKKGLLGLSKKKLLLFGLPAVILLLGGAGAGIMLLGGGGDEAAHAGEDGQGEQHAAAPAAPYYFYEMPEMLVNINGGDGNTAFLKLKLNIEVADEALLPVLDETMPRVIDRYQAFLRELRPEDLSGSAGYYRLKLELLRRVNLAIAPAEAQAVNIDQLLIQ